MGLPKPCQNPKCGHGASWHYQLKSGRGACFWPSLNHPNCLCGRYQRPGEERVEQKMRTGKEIEEQLAIEQQAFQGFKFQLSQLVRHRTSGEVGMVVARHLFQAQTGNTGHFYLLSLGIGCTRRCILEIELEVEPE